MTGPHLEFHPRALQEAENAVAWYAERSMRAAERFVEEVEAAVAAIRETPERWSRFDGEARRMLLRRYPYIVIYRVLTDRIQVLAVAHGRRRPGYWHERLK
jgi:plasmid stabilization system protein ParE